jgi:hypothetical protein
MSGNWHKQNPPSEKNWDCETDPQKLNDWSKNKLFVFVSVFVGENILVSVPT